MARTPAYSSDKTGDPSGRFISVPPVLFYHLFCLTFGALRLLLSALMETCYEKKRHTFPPIPSSWNWRTTDEARSAALSLGTIAAIRKGLPHPESTETSLSWRHGTPPGTALQKVITDPSCHCGEAVERLHTLAAVG
jgi:hypothetical protein